MTRARLVLWLAERTWLPRRWRNRLYALAYRLLFLAIVAGFERFIKGLGRHLIPALQTGTQAMSDFYHALVDEGYLELEEKEPLTWVKEEDAPWQS